jgi:hypothetical protein
MLKRHVLPNVAALAGGLTIGLIVGSAVGAGLATLVFACAFTVLQGR